MNYNNFRTILFFIIAGLVFPILILAEANSVENGTATGTKINVSGNFCKNIAENSSKIKQKIADLEGKLAERRAQSTNKISQLQNDRDKKLTENRGKWDVKRNDLYAKIESQTSGSNQKKAVASFKTAVEQAVFARRAAIDSAIDNFRNTSVQIFIDRKTASDQAILNYKIAVKAALDKAQSDCQGDIGVKTARKNLASSLKAAREVFNIEKQGVGKTGISIQEAQNIKKEAIEKAITDFKSALSKAKEDLKQSLPNVE